MINDAFKIFVEQLRDGHTETLKETFSPDFIDIQDEEVHFKDDVVVEGSVYLAEQALILHLQIDTDVILPCAICNNPVRVPVHVKEFYHTVPLEEIKTGVYNIVNLVREAILLEVPQFAECEQGKCPDRKEISKYLKKESKDNPSSVENGYQPFADLE